MRIFQFLFLLLLAGLIFGSAAYFGYELFIKPTRIERMEKTARASAPSPTATPDPAKASFDRLKSSQEQSGPTTALRDEWVSWTATYTNSPLLPEGRKLLGEANMALLFQPGNDPSLLTYTVVKGDSLAKIASRQHSSAELIQRANQLPGINLQIGQQLVVPKLDITLEIDRAAKTLTLLNNGTYLKEYTLLSCPEASTKASAVHSKIVDKMASDGAKRVAFGSKSYNSAEKLIILSQEPSILAISTPPAPTPVPGGTNTPLPVASAPMPEGFILSAGDLQEIFPLVSRNASVIIH